ncbi:STAS domain-containing protein [Kordiimonas marina]|uniref:STAS domain-containing protein n=1 Tax=Kordiimonas marina TaxID=2872312 RepID=UPI001FF66613|nr:STAS domain-containing protein [Kordiimonas marina]MCJ9427955.1 STAS domain-containing protein [Kordiimonas marina]
MRYTLTTGGTTATVSLEGQLTFGDQAEFRTMLKELTAQSQDRCLVDIQSLEFIDSAGLGLLLRAKSNITDAGKSVALKVPDTGQVKDILDIAQFHQLFDYD